MKVHREVVKSNLSTSSLNDDAMIYANKLRTYIHLQYFISQTAHQILVMMRKRFPF